MLGLLRPKCHDTVQVLRNERVGLGVEVTSLQIPSRLTLQPLQRHTQLPDCLPMMPAGPTAYSTPFASSSWTSKMARLLLIPDIEEGLVVPALVLKATDYWPRIFLHAVWRELQAGDNQGRRLLRVTYSGLDLVYMYECPSTGCIRQAPGNPRGLHSGTSAETTPPRYSMVYGGFGRRRMRTRHRRESVMPRRLRTHARSSIPDRSYYARIYCQLQTSQKASLSLVTGG